jgi:hypothetical protein
LGKRWSEQEYAKLQELSEKYPPKQIAQMLKRSETSVRQKLREMGLTYLSYKESKVKEIQNILIHGQSSEDQRKAGPPDAASSFGEPSVLEEFWKTLFSVAHIAQKRGKKLDVLNFIHTYRKIRMESNPSVNEGRRIM